MHCRRGTSEQGTTYSILITNAWFFHVFTVAGIKMRSTYSNSSQAVQLDQCFSTTTNFTLDMLIFERKLFMKNWNVLIVLIYSSSHLVWTSSKKAREMIMGEHWIDLQYPWEIHVWANIESTFSILEKYLCIHNWASYLFILCTVPPEQQFQTNLKWYET